jgi:hypothetical protein
MNIAAGVLLILAAIINGCAGSGYALGGAASSAAGVVGNKVGSEIAKQQVQEGKPAESDTTASVQALSTTAKTAGAGLMAFGLFLYAVLGLQIAGAVLLFLKKAKTFIVVVAVLSLLAEVVGGLLTVFGASNIIGLLAGIFALVAIRSYRMAAPQIAPPSAGAGV